VYKETQWKINKWGKERRAIEETKNERDRGRKKEIDREGET
jgi:hypothetical protein